jgi:flagellar basal-body rod protein FlgF
LPGPSNAIGRLKLVNPPEADLTRSADGTFTTKSGSAEVDANVQVISGALESSNVNVVDAMVTMISLARQFETQMKLVQSAENNANKASQLMSMG